MHDDSPAEQEDEEKPLSEKGAKKRLRELQEEFEVLKLDPWERYRALIDLAKNHTDTVEIADRKTRFALVILAAMNTLNIVAVARPEILTGVPTPQGLGVAIYVTLYAVLSLYLCIQAIGALKPRLGTALRETAEVSKSQKWLDLLSIDVMPKIGADEYYELWRTAQVGQLNRELAFRNQMTASIILQKYAALNRLYHGLVILVLLTSTLILYQLYSRFSVIR
jgi:hypothetical protein